MRQAVILVGGKGSRLGELTENFPKPLLDINGTPFLSRLIEKAKAQGLAKILLLAGHGFEHIIRQYNEITHDPDITVHVEKTPMGTGGALLDAMHLLEEEFMLLNGDSILDANWSGLIPQLKENFTLSMALRHVDNVSRYGSVRLDGTKVSSFNEKAATQTSEGLINAGIYAINRDKLLPYLSCPCSLETDIMPLLAKEKQISGTELQGYFIDIGLPETLELSKSELDINLTKPVVIFDRDNTLIKDEGYTYKIESLEWLTGAKEAILTLNNQGYLVCIATNQAGIARGFYREEDMNIFHQAMQSDLQEMGAHIDGFFFCPHHIDGKIAELSIACDCRKPKDGMLQQLSRKFKIHPEQSFMIGDTDKDMQCASDFGIEGLLYSEGSLLDLVNSQILAPQRRNGL